MMRDESARVSSPIFPVLLMRTLLLPCETRSRELDAKLLLGVVAAVRGITSVVGSKKTMDLHLSRYPDGLYIGKSVTARSRHNLMLAERCGHRVVLWDEEGLVWASREVYWRTKVDGSTLNTPELMLAWGEENAEAWREHPEYGGGSIIATGNPRADLLRPEFTPFFDKEKKEISDKYGKFILINTNFSRVNHVQPRQNRHLKWLRENRPDDPRGGFATHKHALFQAFLEMLPRLSEALPEVRFVMRPHPSERLETWRELADGLKNVTVAHSGNVVAWLLAADGLIHNGCTTAVEGFQLGRASLAWMPARSPRYDHPLPNGLSIQADRMEDLLEWVRSCNSDPAGAFAAQATQTRRALMERNVAAGPGIACDRILDALEPILDNVAPPIGARRGSASAALALRRVFRIIEHRMPGTANYRPYLRHMFPLTRLEEARERVDRLCTCLGIDERVEVRQLQPDVFRIIGASATD